jgi:chemotaxis protein MotB
MARKQRHHEEEHVNHERWLITYADMLTLLMVLFIVLFAMSTTDAKKFFALKASLQEAFSVGLKHGDDASSLSGDSGSSFVPQMMNQPLAKEVIAMTGRNTPDPHLVQSLSELRQAAVQIPVPSDSSGHVEVGATREGIVISLSGNLLFDSGKSDLKPQGLVLLDTLAERLRTMPNEIRIEGHTDNVPIATPLYPSNWELSSARAITVGRYLAEHDAITPTRLVAAGYGEYRPVVSNDTREGRARNRRVDLVVLYPQLPSDLPAVAGARPPDRGSQP